MPDFEATRQRRQAMINVLRDLGEGGVDRDEMLDLISDDFPQARLQSIEDDLRQFEKQGWVVANKPPRSLNRRFTITPKGERLKEVPKQHLHQAHYRKTPSAVAVETLVNASTNASANGAVDPMDEILEAAALVKELRTMLTAAEEHLRQLVNRR